MTNRNENQRKHMREKEKHVNRKQKAGNSGPVQTGAQPLPADSRTGFREILLLNILLLVYSFSNVFSKLAAGETFLSIRFCLYYGAVLFLLAVYALGWQQIIRKMPLTTAFAQKAVTVVWGILWGILFFGEKMTWGKGFGALLIIAGILLFSTEEAPDGKGVQE